MNTKTLNRTDKYYKRITIEQYIDDRSHSTYLVRRNNGKVIGEGIYYSFPSAEDFVHTLVDRTQKIRNIKAKRKWKKITG